MVIEKLQTSSRLVLTIVASVILIASFYFIGHPPFKRGSSEPAKTNPNPSEQQQPNTTNPVQPSGSQSQNNSQSTSCNTSQKATFTSQYNDHYKYK
jgi:hypothetical protein